MSEVHTGGAATTVSAAVGTPVPAPMSVRELLGDLLGRNVDVSPAPPYAPANSEAWTLAAYVDDSYVVRAVATVDLELSVVVAAAIGLVPMRAVSAALAEQCLDDSLTENLHEVLNIAASLLNADGARHVRLHQMFGPGAPRPSEFRSAALSLGRRLDLQVAVAGYGRGRFSLVALG